MDTIRTVKHLKIQIVRYLSPELIMDAGEVLLALVFPLFPLSGPDHSHRLRDLQSHKDGGELIVMNSSNAVTQQIFLASI